MSKKFIAIATLIGTIIGAGILGIPYVVMRSGFLLGLANLIIAGLIVLIINLYLGEIGLRTKTNHHLSGYAQLYLGKKGKILMFLAFAFGIYSALIAYIIGESQSLSFLFLGKTSHAIYFGLAFWLALSLLSYRGLKALKKWEKIGVTAVFILILLMIVAFWNKINISNLTYNHFSNFYIPFGVILFAFLGFAAIPEVERILEKKKYLTKKVIISAYILVFIIYTTFTIIVLGSQGSATPPIATLALGKIFVLLGIITMFTSYLALSIALIDSFHLDFNISRKRAWLYTITLPLLIFIFLTLTGQLGFTKILGIGGVISGGLTGTLILLMVRRAKAKGKRRPEYSMPFSRILALIIILILAAATVLEIINI